MNAQLRITNALLLVIAVCLLWLCLSPSVPANAYAQPPAGVQRVIIVGSQSYQSGQYKDVPLRVAIAAAREPVPVRIAGVQTPDGAMAVRLAPEKKPSSQKAAP